MSVLFEGTIVLDLKLPDLKSASEAATSTTYFAPLTSLAGTAHMTMIALRRRQLVRRADAGRVRHFRGGQGWPGGGCAGG